jgi:Glyoxalase/Bleomycin resistance protein/Dioxygenase superfamily
MPRSTILWRRHSAFVERFGNAVQARYALCPKRLMIGESFAALSSARTSLASQAATLSRWVDAVSGHGNLRRHLSPDALHRASADAEAGSDFVREAAQQSENGPSFRAPRRAGTGLEAEGRYPYLTLFSRCEGLMPEAKKARAVGFNHIALEVGDIEEALSFYSRIFEFQLRGKNEDTAFIDLGDQFLALQKGRRQPPDDGRHFGLVVDDKTPGAMPEIG